MYEKVKISDLGSNMDEYLKQSAIKAGEDWIKHHGIMGQKWGQRNGPPYPLDASDHSAAEKKAAKYGSKADKAEKKSAKYLVKAGKAQKGGLFGLIKPNEKKAAKYMIKSGKESLKAQKYKTKADKINKELADEKAKIEKEKAEANERTKKYEAAYQEVKAADLLSTDAGGNVSKERLDRAAEIGLQGMFNAKQLSWDADEIKENKKLYKDWFLYEDQTIGYPTVADLVIRGKSHEEIVNLIEKSNEAGFLSKTADDVPGAYEIADLWYYRNDKVKDFVDGCQKALEEEKKTVKHSAISKRDYYLAHHGIRRN